MIARTTIEAFMTQTARPALRDRAEKIRNSLGVHSRKLPPTEILQAFRPNEKPEHKKYRESAYKPVTYGWFNKVKDQFEKIRSAEDFKISWPDLDNNNLKEYTQENFPEHDTVENWLFKFQLANILDDPNGIIVILPKNIQQLLEAQAGLNTAENFQPIPFYFDSKMVQDSTEDFACVKYTEVVPGTVTEREVFLFFDKDQIVKAYYNNGQPPQTITIKEYTHRMGEYSGFACGGIYVEKEGDRWLYDSFIAPAIPAWDEAIEGESDHKVDKALHLHPDRWSIAVHKCEEPGCNSGMVSVNMVPTPCKSCSGTGYKELKSPFGEMKITPLTMGMGAKEMPPMPPAGYITRPIETIKLTKELADAKIFDGLLAINLEMIGEALLNQSGKAKEYDRLEINTYVGKVAAHLVNNILLNVYHYVNAWLNIGMTPDLRKKLMPTIKVPQKFDLITTEVWMDRVSAYKKDGANPAALAQAEIKLAERQHGMDSPAFKMIRDSIELDPLYGYNPAEKSEAMMNNGCSATDYIISTKIHFFIRRAAQETKNKFFDLDYAAKTAQLEKYAQETIAKASQQNPLIKTETESEK